MNGTRLGRSTTNVFRIHKGGSSTADKEQEKPLKKKNRAVGAAGFRKKIEKKLSVSKNKEIIGHWISQLNVSLPEKETELSNRSQPTNKVKDQSPKRKVLDYPQRRSRS